MKKRYITYTLVTLLTLSVAMETINMNVLADTSVSENASVSENVSVSEDSVDEISAERVIYEPEDYEEVIYPDKHSLDVIEEYRKKHANDKIITLKYENNGTWGYDQTWARTELFPRLQAARMNPDNWWIRDKVTNEPTILPTPSLPIITKKYEYDTDLEAFAMQRAAEMILTYAHKRPTGQYPQEILREQGSIYQWCNNYCEMLIFAPMKTASDDYVASVIENNADAIVDGFMEEYNTSYAGQQHRRGILTNDYYRIGIGVVKLEDDKDDKRLIAIEVAEDRTSNDAVLDEWFDDEKLKRGQQFIPLHKMENTPPVNGYKETYVSFATDNEAGGSISASDVIGTLTPTGLTAPKELIPGQTYDLNDTWFSIGSSPAFSLCKGNNTAIFTREWVSDKPNVATVADGVITAIAPGDATIVTYDSDNELIGGVPVVVPERQITSFIASYANTSALVGTRIYSSNIMITASYNYGSDVTDTLYNLTRQADSFVVKEGTNSFTVNINGMTSTFNVTGTKPVDTETGKGGNGGNTDQPKPVNPNPNPNPVDRGTAGAKLYTQKITVGEKFQNTLSVKYKALKKSAKTYKIGAKVTTNGGTGHGLVSYEVTKYPKGAKKYIKVSSKGKITLRKGAKKGTYKIRITAKAVKNEFKKATKTITIKVK